MKNRISTMLFFVFLISLMLDFSGCSHTPVNKNYTGASLMPPEISTQYDYKKFNGVYYSEKISENDCYTLIKVTFTPSHSIIDFEHEIVIDFYEAKSNCKTPVILVLPILGGSNYFAKSFANYFAENGFSAVIVHRQKKFKSFKDIKKIDRNLRQIVFDHKQAIDWIEMQGDLDTSKIGVFGISMGSIKAALISALDKRVKASVMCLTGGNIPEIIMTSDEKGVVEKREKFLQENNINRNELRSSLEKIITCDPINYAPFINARNSMIVLGYFDSTVPYKNGLELWKKIGEPEKVTLFAGHYTAILFLPYVKYLAGEFFKRKLL